MCTKLFSQLQKFEVYIKEKKKRHFAVGTCKIFINCRYSNFYLSPTYFSNEKKNHLKYILYEWRGDKLKHCSPKENNGVIYQIFFHLIVIFNLSPLLHSISFVPQRNCLNTCFWSLLTVFFLLTHEKYVMIFKKKLSERYDVIKRI